jgi:hypothetical protein
MVQKHSRTTVPLRILDPPVSCGWPGRTQLLVPGLDVVTSCVLGPGCHHPETPRPTGILYSTLHCPFRQLRRKCRIKKT